MARVPVSKTGCCRFESYLACFIIQESEMNKIFRFFQESYAELRKVMWPTQDEVVDSTKVVIVSTLLIALILGMFDALLHTLMNVIF
jgi:preprotein translocase subunit SecE